MARNQLQRRVKSTKVKYSIVNVSNGEGTLSEPKTAQFEGKLQEHQVHNKLNDIETEKFVILETTVHEALYTMSITDFIKHAKKVEEKNQEENEGNE